MAVARVVAPKPAADGLITCQPHVVRPVVVVKDVDSPLGSEIADFELSSVLPDPSEQPIGVSLPTSWCPLDLVCAPEQSVAPDESTTTSSIGHGPIVSSWG